MVAWDAWRRQVVIERPRVVVLWPIISEQGAEVPGNMELSEEFLPLPDIF